MRTARVEPWAAAALLALAYLIVAPASADLAAQIYRVDLFREEGFTLWNGQWYSGHHTLGYSVLFPPLGALLGTRVVGALAAVAAAALFPHLARSHFGERAWIGSLWFGVGAGAMLLTGRLTFLLGVALGLGALLAAQRERRWTATGLALACTLASPVAGLFLALAGAAWTAASRRKLPAVVAAAAFVPSVVLAFAFPEPGIEPFVASAFWPVILFAAVSLALLPREERALRIGVVLYALACTAAFLIDTPMGGNATRLGALFGGPVLACALYPRRALALAALALPLLYWQLQAPVRDVARTAGDPSVHASYYQPLLDELRRTGAVGRLEIPFTRNHFEAAYVAPKVPLARGWERQLDIKYNRLFYEPGLTPARYRRWLERSGVQYVALPDAPLDRSSGREARLISGGLPYLRPIWRNRHWRLYEVVGARPLVEGPARLRQMGSDWLALSALGPGSVLVRVRYSPYWRLEGATGCVERAPGGWTRLRLRGAGEVRLATRFSPRRVVARGPRCTSAPAA